MWQATETRMTRRLTVKHEERRGYWCRKSSCITSRSWKTAVITATFTNVFEEKLIWDARPTCTGFPGPFSPRTTTFMKSLSGSWVKMILPVWGRLILAQYINNQDV